MCECVTCIYIFEGHTRALELFPFSPKNGIYKSENIDNPSSWCYWIKCYRNQLQRHAKLPLFIDRFRGQFPFLFDETMSEFDRYSSLVLMDSIRIRHINFSQFYSGKIRAIFYWKFCHNSGLTSTLQRCCTHYFSF